MHFDVDRARLELIRLRSVNFSPLNRTDLLDMTDLVAIATRQLLKFALICEMTCVATSVTSLVRFAFVTSAIVSLSLFLAIEPLSATAATFAAVLVPQGLHLRLQRFISRCTCITRTRAFLRAKL